MLKFNLTQEGKSAIDALQNNDKLAITHIRLLQSDNSPSVDLPISRGAIVVDGTCNGPYAVVDVNDASDNHYIASAVALLSDTKSIAELYSDEKASGYEVVLSAGAPGRTAYPSIKYRTQTWTSGKIPSSVEIAKGASNDCDVNLSFGSKGGDPGDPSSQPVTAHLTLGDNFPKTITFSNGDIWETDDTVSTTGVKNGRDSYWASSENGETSIRPLYSKISIQKESNKQLKLRLSCQFDGAEKCKFNTTSINLPYASRFREGVVRLADPSMYGNDGQRYNTVYSAADVDAKISQVTDSLGNLDQYAKKATENTFAENNTFEKDVIVNGEIGGNAVATLGMNINEKNAMVVSLGYADNKYLTKANATDTYLTKNEATTTYLTKQAAETTYLTQTDATATYLTKEAATQAAVNYAKLNADNNFVANTTNTFNGDVTVKGTFVVGESQEAATFAVTHDGIITGTAIQNDKVSVLESDKLTTEGAVKSALNDVNSALTQKDNELQSQIDGINAGQNLADIVDTTDALAAYDISHLKAKGDSLPGKPSTPLTIGDKVQVLGGADAQSSVYELIKGTKPESEANSIVSSTNGYYWRYIGVYGTNAYTKAEINEKVDAINSAISAKADTSYVDTELGDKVDKTQIKTTISGDTATDTNIPSASAVKTYVDGELANKANSADVYSKTEADDKFAVKTGDNTFTGNNTFNGTIIGSAVTSEIAKDITEQGNKLTTSAGVSIFVNTVVDDKITTLNLDGSYLKLNSETTQTVTSNVEFNGTISGSAVAEVAQKSDSGSKLLTVDYANEKLAQLASNNNFAGATNTFQEVSATKFSGNGVAAQVINTNIPDQVTTSFAVANFVTNAITENKNAISNKNKVGAMGLFLYTGGDFKEMGTEVAGTSLQAVGMQLPMDGVVSWSQGATMEGQWKLLNNTIAGEPCLVLAIRVV